MDRGSITYTAEEYSRTKKSGKFRDDVEFHTIFSLIGNPTGLRILDAGCGDGIYARELIERGAARVIGVDCAEDFVKLAKEKSQDYNNIEYHQVFVQDFIGEENLDLVVGSFILSYPKNLEEAISYCKAIASNLKEGGRFIGFNNNPFDVYEGERYSKYGFKKIMKGEEESREVRYLIDGMTDPVINFYLRPKTYEKAFREAGFSEFKWQRVLLTPSENGNPYWDDFFKVDSEFPSPFIAMLAKK